MVDGSAATRGWDALLKAIVGPVVASLLVACSRAEPPRRYTPVLSSALPAPERAAVGATVTACAECQEGSACVEEARDGKPQLTCARIATAEQIAAPPGTPHATRDEFLGVPVMVKGTQWKRTGVTQTLLACVAKPGHAPDDCCNTCRASIELAGLPGVTVVSSTSGQPGCAARCCDPLICSSWIPDAATVVDVAGRFERIRPSVAEGTLFRLIETAAEVDARRPVSAEHFLATATRWKRAAARVVRFLPARGKAFPASGWAWAQLPEELQYDPLLKTTTEPCAVRSADGRTAVDMLASRNPLGRQYGYIFAEEMTAEEATALLERGNCPRWRRPFPVAPNWWAAELVFPR